jgi:hypothetical protein
MPRRCTEAATCSCIRNSCLPSLYRIRWIVRLGRRRPRSYVWAAAGPTDIVPIAKIEGQNAHQNLLVDCPPLPASAGFSDEGDKSLVPSQFTFARWGRPRAGTRSPRSKLADQGTSDSPSPRRVAYPYGSPAGCRRASNPRPARFFAVASLRSSQPKEDEIAF